MTRNKKKRLPSQQRYDQSHPVVSFRLPAELYNRLKEHLKEQSCAAFVKSHLDAEDAQVKARVEELARKRDNLRATILTLKREVEELNKQIDQRRRDMLRPIEEEKARLQKELRAWYEREKTNNELRLEGLRSEEKEVEDKVRKAKLDLVFAESGKKFVEAETKQWLKERETWERRMQQATQFINTYPWFFCHQCPGAAFNQLLQHMMNTVTSASIKGKELETGSQPSQAQTNG
jgi:chromosome segregation ATPase